ncbi:MAG: hypothetical protein O3A00_29030, partial [Planctomycetota bacterium]|nr:hypothetical protein [Planctomycetota bacterium]
HGPMELRGACSCTIITWSNNMNRHFFTALAFLSCALTVSANAADKPVKNKKYGPCDEFE